MEKVIPAVPSGLDRRTNEPLNMALNEGTYCPDACRAVFQWYGEREACRRYSSSDNLPLRALLAERHGVEPTQIFLANGSGPLLKQAIPHIIKQEILRSPVRVLKQVAAKLGYPIIAPRLTYCKVLRGAHEKGLSLQLLPCGPDNDFRLDLPGLERVLARHDGLVYLCNPNNPTGQVLIRRDELAPLLGRYPRSTFWIDEAYIHYVTPSADLEVADLTRAHPNLVVSRSFSFAYGLAAVRIGYLVASAARVAELDRMNAPYRLGKMQEDLAIAALHDEGHLPFVREKTAEARRFITEALSGYGDIDVYPSETNFLLCRMKSGRDAAQVHAGLLERGIAVKLFEPFARETYDEYFRITIGIEPENALLAEALKGVLR